MVGKFLATAGRSVQEVMESHCQSASELADRLQLGEAVCVPLVQAFERWDGRGVPGRVGHADLAPAIRLVHLADSIEAFHDRGGIDAAVEVATARRGTQFDPGLVDCFCASPDVILAGIGTFQAWDQVIDLDPRLGEELTAEQLDAALFALGDFADLKSPLRSGHSRGVAELVGDAARSAGMADDDVRNLVRAGAIHDVGMVGVTSAVWDATEPWSVTQQERARTHPYLTGGCSPGSPRWLRSSRARRSTTNDSTAAATPTASRAARSPCRRGCWPRPTSTTRCESLGPIVRPSPADAAAAMLHEEVRHGRLDGDAVGAVLTAAGHRVPRRAALPAGLTRREVEVLVLLARGLLEPADRHRPDDQPQDRVVPPRAHLHEARRARPGPRRRCTRCRTGWSNRSTPERTI